jgi:hypothetical protein
VKRLGLRQTRPSATAIAALMVVCGLVAAAVSGIDASGLLHLAPALVLAVALLARRYPGERLIVRLAGSGARHPRRPRTGALKPRTSRAYAAALVPRGGLLLARSLAVRPPPVTVRASHC